MNLRDDNIELKRTVPIIRAVSAAIIDMHEDIGKCEEIYSHWAVRIFKELNRQTLELGKRKVILTINRSTNTASLPPDFHHEFFMGPIVNGVKVPMRLRSDLVDPGTEEIECDDRCPRCGQDKAICNDLTVTETTELVQIGNDVGTKTIVKRLHPNGDYMLEITFPVLNTETQSIEYFTTKEFITCIDMKPCGCPDLTNETVNKIKCFAPDVFCCHLTECDCNTNTDVGGYRIFEETGVIVFDNPQQFTKVYMEYQGFLPKKNGQYYIPEISFEAIVEGTKYKAIQNKKGVPQWERRDQKDSYREKRANMEKELWRFPLATIMDAAMMVPQFDWKIPARDMCFVTKPQTVGGTTVSVVSDCAINTSSSQSISTTTILGGLVARVDWTTVGTEGRTLFSAELKGKRLIYFNLENNDSYKIITQGSPTEREILFDSIAGTITMMFPFEAGVFAYAIYASQLNPVSDLQPVSQQFTTLNDWWPTDTSLNYVSVGTVASGKNGYLLVPTDMVIKIAREGFEYDIVTTAPVGRQVRFNDSLMRAEFEFNFNPGETISVEFKRKL